MIGDLNELLRLLLLCRDDVTVLVNILNDLRLPLLPIEALYHSVMVLFRHILLLLLWLLYNNDLSSLGNSMLRLLLLTTNDKLLW